MANNPGYIFSPYIISTTVSTISSSGFTPNNRISSRYSKAVSGNYYGIIITKNQRRIKKIKNLLGI